jgi:malonyl-CoA O-methyltransferase
MNEFAIDKRAVRRAFSRAASQYDAAAVLQREVCERMLERLDYIRLQPQSVLDAGCGTGWGTRQLGRRYSKARIVGLDIAQGMLQATRKRLTWWQRMAGLGRQSLVCADVEALPLADNSVDLVWSNLALQWCNDLPATLSGLNRIVKPDGLLMFSTFGPDTLKELRAAFQGVDGHQHVSRFADMHDVGDMLQAAGFTEPVMDMEILTLTYDDVRAVMQDLKSIGAHNAVASRAQGMMSKGAWQRVLQNYERLRLDGKLPATFEVIYGHAWKPAPKLSSDGRAIIKTNFKL